MRSLSYLSRALALCALLGTGAAAAPADEPCVGFKWDVSKERALFAASAPAEQAGKSAGSTPVIVPDRLYQLQLLPARQVEFPAHPGKTPGEGTYAGLAALKISRSGAYRVSVDLPLWIDVAAGGQRVPATDYQGQQRCDAPHKIVQFDLDAARPLILQFSGSIQPTVRLTVTRVES